MMPFRVRKMPRWVSSSPSSDFRAGIAMLKFFLTK